MIYRPTILGMASKHCERAIDFYEQGVPYDRSVYAVGVAAHAVLQALGNSARLDGSRSASVSVVESACRALIETGRIEEGMAEPPLAPDAVFTGRDLALEWLQWHDLSATAHCEIGLAVDANWNPVSWNSPAARLRCILDVLDAITEETDETAFNVLLIRDYKSVWSADEGELDTLQRKAQVLVAYAHREYLSGLLGMGGDDFQAIRTEIGNLRTKKLHADTIVLSEGTGPELLALWRRDLTITMDALDEQKAKHGKRLASPGAGCIGCPFVHACDDAHDYIENTRIPGTAQRRAVQYAVAKALTEKLADMLRQDTDEGPIDIPNGTVGTLGKPTRILSDEGAMKLADEWAMQAGENTAIVEPWLRGFVRAADLSVSAAESVAKKLFPARSDKQERERFMAEITAPSVRRSFGVWPKGESK